MERAALNFVFVLQINVVRRVSNARTFHSTILVNHWDNDVAYKALLVIGLLMTYGMWGRVSAVQI